MATYTENLYQNIFGNYANRFLQLRIISGYGSAKFLKRVMDEYPHLNIELYLGMTAEGVLIDNHNEYLLTCRQNEGIKVFYQISGIPNHMKILEYSNGIEKKLLVGSANFTENGFIYQKELMTEIEETLDFLFEDQINRSMLCTEQNIADFVNLYSEPLELQIDTEDDKINNLEDSTPSVIAATVIHDKPSIYYNNLILLRRNIDWDYYKKFKLPIVLHSHRNHHWASTGINAWTEQRKPVLEQTSRLLFKNVFPDGEEFYIYTDDKLIFRAKLTGKFSRQLELLNADLYRYILNRLKLEENKPISYESLLRRNSTSLYFERINFNEFYMSFNEI